MFNRQDKCPSMVEWGAHVISFYKFICCQRLGTLDMKLLIILL